MDYSWDIARLIRDIDSGKLRPQKETLDRGFIEAYATKVLALDKSKGIEHETVGLLMRVSLKDALALPAVALQEPVIMLETRKGKGLLRLPERPTADHILGDGQHRVAKAYYEDAPELPMHILSAAQSRKYLLK